MRKYIKPAQIQYLLHYLGQIWHKKKFKFKVYKRNYFKGKIKKERVKFRGQWTRLITQKVYNYINEVEYLNMFFAYIIF